MPIHEFHYLQCVVLTSFITDMLNVKRQNTIPLRWIKSSLWPIFSTVKVQVVPNYRNLITCQSLDPDNIL